MSNLAYRYRIYPNARQRAQIEGTFGAARWVWNKCLETCEAEHAAGRKKPSCAALVKMIPRWKKADAPWLAQADSVALQQSARDLDRAYKRFFDNVKKKRRRGKKNPYGHPRFKSKRAGRQSYRTQNFSGANVAVADPRHIKLPKLGAVRAKVSRMPAGRVLSATVVREASGRYFVSLCCADVSPERWPQGRGEVGVDVGSRNVAATSEGKVYPGAKAARRLARKLAREQRRLARKEKGSANRARQRRKVARVHERIADVRRDAAHKATTQIVRESQAVYCEDLDVAAMLEDGSNRRAHFHRADGAMASTVRMLEYKCGLHGRAFSKVDPAFTSQTCSACGAAREVAEGQSVFSCRECGARLDRDVNAAVNILSLGRAGAMVPQGMREPLGRAA